MIRWPLALVCLLNLLLCVSRASAIEQRPVSTSAAEMWIRYTVPLPKDIRIPSEVLAAPADVSIVSRGAEGLLVSQALRELREAIGGAPDDSETARPFTIALIAGGPETEELTGVKNSEQAYRILPGANGKGLRIVAHTPTGLYYGAKTLQQLVKGRHSAQAVHIPLATVTDWPDLEDRGTWGSDNFAHLKWMGDRKLNVAEQISNIGVDSKGIPFASLKSGREPMVHEGPRYGIKPIPVVLHLEQVAEKGVFAAYPELKGKGGLDSAICYSQPAFIDILADWIADLGSLPGVDEVDVWMAENMQGQGGCQCEECSKEDRSVLETRVILKAWDKARQKAGPVGIRVLTSEATEDANRKVFRLLPKDVKIWYYHSLLTYTAGEQPMLRTYLQDFAREGWWIGVCPSLGPAVHFTQPFTGADFIHYRMNEFVDKGMKGLLGYATPLTPYNWFNLEAAAEWSWNAKGRSPREFALSWAVRQRMDNPEKFAEWADTIGPLEWDIYGSDWPAGEGRNTPGKVADRLRKGDLKELGFVLWDAYRSPWGDIDSEAQLEENLRRADRALEMAREMRNDGLIAESTVAQGYIRSLKAVWELKSIVGPDGIAPGKDADARRYFQMYVDGIQQAADALPEWEATVPGAHPEGLTQDAVSRLGENIQRMKDLAAENGIIITS